MPREAIPSINDIVEQVLQDVSIEDAVKTAAKQMSGNENEGIVTSDIKEQLTKVAAYCRSLDQEPQITFDDLKSFMVRANEG